MPGLVPETVEVVELARGRSFVVVRTTPAGLVVLDAAGRLVRGRERLTEIAEHLDAVERARATLGEARIDSRQEHAERSLALLGRLREHLPAGPLAAEAAGLTGALGAFGERLDALAAELARQGRLPPTRRTLGRTVALLNEAAAADRAVVRASRRAAAALAQLPDADGDPRLAGLHRWLAARLAGPDLPFSYAELDEPERTERVAAFVAEATARA